MRLYIVVTILFLAVCAHADEPPCIELPLVEIAYAADLDDAPPPRTALGCMRIASGEVVFNWHGTPPKWAERPERDAVYSYDQHFRAHCRFPSDEMPRGLVDCLVLVNGEWWYEVVDWEGNVVE
jgi:hypothetical protein